MTRKFSNEELQAAVQSSYSIAEVCRKVGLKPAGGNYSTVKKYVKLWNISTAHFRGQGWNVGLGFKPKHATPISELLTVDSHYQPNKLRRRLLREGLKDHRCEHCERSQWNQQKIPLELHHCNGVRTDNRIENLMLLCPNCHAQTANYRGKNIRVARQETAGVESVKFGERFCGDTSANTEPSSACGEGVET